MHRGKARSLITALRQIGLVSKRSVLSEEALASSRFSSHTSESTIVWPPPAGVASEAAVTWTNSPREAPGNLRSADETEGPRRKEVLELLARSSASRRTVAKRNLRSLRVWDLREALQRWGYETVGLKKVALIDRMHDAITEEDASQSSPTSTPEQVADSPLRASVAETAEGSLRGPQARDASSSDRPASRPLQHTAFPPSQQPRQHRKLESLSPAQVAEWLSEARTDDVRILDVRGFCPFADHLVLASGRSNQHVHAASSGLCWQIMQKVENYHRANSLYREGGEDSDWIAIDTGGIVVHVMTKEARALYNLEELWGREISAEYSSEDSTELHEEAQSVYP